MSAAGGFWRGRDSGGQPPRAALLGPGRGARHDMDRRPCLGGRSGRAGVRGLRVQNCAPDLRRRLLGAQQQQVRMLACARSCSFLSKCARSRLPYSPDGCPDDLSMSKAKAKLQCLAGLAYIGSYHHGRGDFGIFWGLF